MLQKLPEMDPPPFLSAVVMARMKHNRSRRHPLISSAFFRWASLGASVAILLVFSVVMWQIIPSNLSWPLPGNSKTRLASEVLPDRSPSKLTVTRRNSNSSDSVVIIKVKDFSRADRQLTSLLRTFAPSMVEEQKRVQAVRSSSARLFDLQVPGQRFPYLIRELNKIGYLDPEQVTSETFDTPRHRKAVSIRLVVISNETDAQTSPREESEKQPLPGKD
jgi:hypothetical protein